MNTIQDLFQQAQLAEAAYANFYDVFGNPITTDAQLISALTNSDAGGGFSQAQATVFAERYQFVSQYSAPGLGPLDGGFSATVFLDTTTNAYTFAIRGTVGLPADLIGADFGDIVLDGLAIDQIVDMYNYWQSLNATGVYQAAKLDTSWDETSRLTALRVLAYDPITALAGMPLYNAYLDELKASGAILDSTLGGLGITVRRIVKGDSNILLTDPDLAYGTGLLSANSVMDVTGHSLGGHLAAAFTRLFSDAGANAITINGAGFPTGSTPGLGGNALSNIQNLFVALNGASTFDSTFITNLHGDGPNFVSMNSQYGLVQQGGHQEIYIESMSIGNTLGHGKEQMTDSLAVYNLFATLDPLLDTATLTNLNTITDFLKAETDIAANTLEGTVSALGKLFNVPGTTFTGSAFDGAGRDKLYTALDAIQTTFLSCYSSVSIVALDAATLLADAGTPDADGLAHRYALVNLNPYAVLGADYSAHNTNGELNLYATGQGQITDAYLADRAAMLGLMIQRNMDDSSTIGGDILYRDVEQRITLRPDTLFANDYALQQIIFGGAGDNNSLTGGDNHDHLYGMGGIDILNGNRGNDYLEGGQGDDKLYGGLDADTYAFHTGDGADTIKDTDGLGTIMLNGAQLAQNAVAYQSPNTWADGNTTYQFTPAGVGQSTGKLLITTPSTGSGQADTITIENFDLAQAITADGYLGIHLENQITIASGANTTAPAPADQTASVTQGALHTFTVFTTAAPNTPLTLLLKLAGAGLYKLINGAEVLAFAADGTVAITIPAGQDSVTLSLLDATNTNQVDAATLSASLTDAGGNVITSNALAVTFDNPYPYAGDITPAAYDLVIYGDFGPMYFETETQPELRLDAGGNLITDPNKPMPNQNDRLYDSVGSDLIYTGGSGTGPNDKNWIFANQSSYNDTTFVTGKAANDAEWRYCHVA